MANTTEPPPLLPDEEFLADDPNRDGGNNLFFDAEGMAGDLIENKKLGGFDDIDIFEEEAKLKKEETSTEKIISKEIKEEINAEKKLIESLPLANDEKNVDPLSSHPLEQIIATTTTTTTTTNTAQPPSPSTTSSVPRSPPSSAPLQTTTPPQMVTSQITTNNPTTSSTDSILTSNSSSPSTPTRASTTTTTSTKTTTALTDPLMGTSPSIDLNTSLISPAPLTITTIDSPSPPTIPTILGTRDPALTTATSSSIHSPSTPTSMLPFQASSSVPPSSSSSSASSLSLFKPPTGFKQVDRPTANLNINMPKPQSANPPDNHHLTITIDDVRKVGDGVNAYMTYRVSMQTDLPAYHHPRNEVYRRFSDFLGLYSRLVEKHAREGRIIPQAPEKSIIGMAKVKVSKNESTTEFVEHRRALLERFLQHIAASPHLRSDPIFVDFLETEGDLIKSTNTNALSGAGVMRLFQKVGEGFSKIAYKMDETDEWYAKKTEDLNSIDLEYRSLQVNLENMIHSRRECSHNMGLLSKSLSMLASIEEDVSLSRVLAQLCEVWDGLECSHQVQVNEDTLNILDYVKDYIGILQSTKDALQERTKTFKLWKDHEVTLAKKRETKIKMELAHKVAEKIAEAEKEVKDWEHIVEKSEEDFERISVNVREEIDRVDVQAMRSFKEVVTSYFESCVANQQRVIKLWETFLIEAKNLAV